MRRGERQNLLAIKVVKSRSMLIKRGERLFSLVWGRPKITLRPEGGRGSTILLHIVTYISGGRGVFYEIVT